MAPPEPAHLVAVAAWIRREIDRLNAAVGADPGAGDPFDGIDREYVVLVGGGPAGGGDDRGERAHPVSFPRDANGAVEVEHESARVRYRVETDWRPGLDCFEGTLNGTPIAVQVERRGHGFRLAHAGHADLYQVLNLRAAGPPGGDAGQATARPLALPPLPDAGPPRTGLGRPGR